MSLYKRQASVMIVQVEQTSDPKVHDVELQTDSIVIRVGEAELRVKIDRQTGLSAVYRSKRKSKDVSLAFSGDGVTMRT